jgi:hypothetical protein
MATIIEQLRQLRQQGLNKQVVRGKLPGVSITNDFLRFRIIGVFIISAFLGFVSMTILEMSYQQQTLWNAMGFSWSVGLEAGVAVALFYCLYPLLCVVTIMLWRRQRPTRDIFEKFTWDQNFGCLILITSGVFYLFNHLTPTIVASLHNQHWPAHWLSHKPYIAMHWLTQLIVVAVIAFALALIMPSLFPDGTKDRASSLKNTSRNKRTRTPFGLWLGYSTGRLARLWHKTGIAAKLSIVLNTEDASQNILVLGGIGAGKTTRLMQPLLAQLLDQACGGLLLDVKGDVKKAVINLCEMTDRPASIIGPNHRPMNLLAGLTPEVAASFLKSAFLLNGGARMDGFWIDTATELCRNTLGLLSFLPEHYTLQGLYSYLFDDEAREAVQERINVLLATLDTKEQRLLKTYLRYHDSIFSAFDEKVKSGVNATVAQALSPFNHPDLIDAFCEHTETGLAMESVLDGTVYLVDMPLSRWGLGGKVAYTFIKLRFFNVMQSRIHHPEWNQDKPVFFMCDEYQELISASKDGLSDLNFWDKSRSSKTIGIISAQSVSSFYAALGDHDLTHAILQNFRQKLCFRTEDQATLTMMDRLAGQAIVKKKTTSKTTGSGSSSNPKSFFDSTSNHHSSTQSITESRESVLDATLFRHLSPDQAVALLSLNGHSMDDVLELVPVFL